jgi:hypothetical protein
VADKLTATGLEGVFKKVLFLGAIATAAIALLGGIFGYLAASTNGLASALIGAAVCFAFTSLTALSVWFGSRLSIGGFFGVVLGGWIFKLVLFFILIAVLRHASFISGPTFFFTLVASVLAGLAIDSVVFLKARIPIDAKG